MKTQDIQRALHAGDLDAGIIASKLEDSFLTEETLFMSNSMLMYPAKNRRSSMEVIRTSDITGERLWLLDEGHCFRDQLVRFCQMEAVKVSQMAYRVWKYVGVVEGNLFFFGGGEKEGSEKLFCSLWFWCWWSGLQMCFFLCGGLCNLFCCQHRKNIKSHR